MLRRFFDDLAIEAKHNVARLASALTKQYRSFDRIEPYVKTAKELFSAHRRSVVRYNLFEPHM